MNQILFAFSTLKALYMLKSQSRNEILLRKQFFLEYQRMKHSDVLTMTSFNSRRFMWLPFLNITNLFFIYLFLTRLFSQAPRYRPPVFYWDAVVSLVAGDWKHLSLQKRTTLIVHASSMKAQTVSLIRKIIRIACLYCAYCALLYFPREYNRTHT